MLGYVFVSECGEAWVCYGVEGVLICYSPGAFVVTSSYSSVWASESSAVCAGLVCD